MIPRRFRTKRGLITSAMAAAAIASGAVIAATGPGGVAVAFFSPPLLLDIHVVSPATLVAKGAAADVTLQVECAGTRTAFVSLSLNERFGKQIASGFGFTEVGCTGSQQTIVVQVLAQPIAFKRGIAIADANISGCTRRFCGNQEDNETILLTK